MVNNRFDPWSQCAGHFRFPGRFIRHCNRKAWGLIEPSETCETPGEKHGMRVLVDTAIPSIFQWTTPSEAPELPKADRDFIPVNVEQVTAESASAPSSYLLGFLKSPLNLMISSFLCSIFRDMLWNTPWWTWWCCCYDRQSGSPGIWGGLTACKVDQRDAAKGPDLLHR